MPELVLDKISYAHADLSLRFIFHGELTCANPMLHESMFQAKNMNF
jgi:hypothetical protein